MRVAIVASSWCKREEVEEYIKNLPPDTEIVTGQDLGCFSFIVKQANKYGLPVRVCILRWGAYGDWAPKVRNKNILTRSDRCVVFHMKGDYVTGGFLTSVEKLDMIDKLEVKVGAKEIFKPKYKREIKKDWGKRWTT